MVLSLITVLVRTLYSCPLPLNWDEELPNPIPGLPFLSVPSKILLPSVIPQVSPWPFGSHCHDFHCFTRLSDSLIRICGCYLTVLSVHSLVSIFRYLTAYNFWPIAFPLFETFINVMSSQKAFLSPLLQLLSSSLGILSIKVVSHQSFQANHY